MINAVMHVKAFANHDNINLIINHANTIEKGND